MLLIKGHDLHVNRLSLEKGEIDIEGRIDSLTYSGRKMLQNRRNLFLEGFLNNVWICAAGGRNPVLAGAGDRKQGERGDFTEAVFLGISVLVGMGLFLLYDIFVFSEESCHMAQSGLEWKDFCYWLLCTAAVFLMLYQENDGMIRGFAIGGVIFRHDTVFFLLSRFVVKINVCILKKILGIAEG